MKRLLLVALAVAQTGCWPFPHWPKLPEHGTCRNFAITDWGGQAPWSEVQWSGPAPDIAWIDEPMLPMWGWPYDLDNPVDVCGPRGLGMVAQSVDDLRRAAPGRKVWLNWSTDEIDAISKHCPGVTWHQGADIFSFDSYGGLWDWEVKTRWLLDMFYVHASAEHQMGLVPDAFQWPDRPEPEKNLVHLAHYYMEWAMRHDYGGKLYAIAPFYWGSSPGMVGMKDLPEVAKVWAAFQQEYPRCSP